jgi:hypothetical protein
MSYLGGVDEDERSMFQTLLHHFALKLQEERLRIADLTRQLECERERVKLLEMQAYGLF